LPAKRETPAQFHFAGLVLFREKAVVCKKKPLNVNDADIPLSIDCGKLFEKFAIFSINFKECFIFATMLSVKNES
jgi:hypothetical protein